MTTLDTLMERNKAFAAWLQSARNQQPAPNLLMPSLPSVMPYVKALIIGCADMRVNPAHLLGLKPGEALVMSNIGGRTVPGTLQQMLLLAQIAHVENNAMPGGGGEFHLIVLQHTDCGITRLAGEPDMLANYFGISKEELEAKAVTNPRAAVAADVAMLRTIPDIPSEWLVSGLVYDVATGLIDIIVPPAPLSDTEWECRL